MYYSLCCFCEKLISPLSNFTEYLKSMRNEVPSFTYLLHVPTCYSLLESVYKKRRKELLYIAFTCQGSQQLQSSVPSVRNSFTHHTRMLWWDLFYQVIIHSSEIIHFYIQSLALRYSCLPHKLSRAVAHFLVAGSDLTWLEPLLTSLYTVGHERTRWQAGSS